MSLFRRRKPVHKVKVDKDPQNLLISALKFAAEIAGKRLVFTYVTEVGKEELVIITDDNSWFLIRPYEDKFTTSKERNKFEIRGTSDLLWFEGETPIIDWVGSIETNNPTNDPTGAKDSSLHRIVPGQFIAWKGFHSAHRVIVGPKITEIFIVIDGKVC